MGAGTDILQVLTGTLWPTASPKAPPSNSGWLRAQGDAVSRSTYSGLMEALTLRKAAQVTIGSATVSGLDDTSEFAAGQPVEGPGIPAGSVVLTVSSTSITISHTSTITDPASYIRLFPHGNGDGSTTFNLPDPRGRSIIGAGSGSGLTVRVNGAKGGNESHALTESEMPLHGHPSRISVSTQATPNSTPTGALMLNPGGQTNEPAYSGTPTAAAGEQIGGTGGGAAHSLMNPWFAAHWIIKT